jgi:hypothetical protein
VTVVFLFQKERTAKKVLLSRRKSAKFIKETESKKKNDDKQSEKFYMPLTHYDHMG